MDKWYILCRVTYSTQRSGRQVVYTMYGYLWNTTVQMTGGIYYLGLHLAHNGAMDKWYILFRVTYSTQRNAGQVVYTR